MTVAVETPSEAVVDRVSDRDWWIDRPVMWAGCIQVPREVTGESPVALHLMSAGELQRVNCQVVTPLPRPGEMVMMPGTWDEVLVVREVQAEGETARLKSSTSEGETRWFGPYPGASLDARRIGKTPSEASRRLVSHLEALSDRLDRQERAFEAWKERATQVAHEYAETNSLCGEFDRCMEEIGLSPRERSYNVTTHITVSVPARALARSEDSAVEQIDDLTTGDLRRAVEDALGEMWPDGWELVSWDARAADRMDD